MNAQDEADRKTVRLAVGQLLRSQRGEKALVGFMEWMTSSGGGLDEMNQQALRTLQGMLWGRSSATTAYDVFEMLGSTSAAGKVGGR